MNNNPVLRDRTVRMIGIPALGVLIPNLAGLITNAVFLMVIAACFIAKALWSNYRSSDSEAATRTTCNICCITASYKKPISHARSNCRR